MISTVMQVSYNSDATCLLIWDLNEAKEVALLIVCGRELNNSVPKKSGETFWEMVPQASSQQELNV